MIGAIAGDVIGSMYEALGEKRYDFPLFPNGARFTDDTVLTVAVAKAVLGNGDYREHIIEFGRRYPLVGYGPGFERWLSAPENGPYNSWGNGSAMRASPIGFSGVSEAFVLAEAKRCAEVTHNHPEGVKGAQAAALCVYMARTGAGKEDIRKEVESRFGYDLQRTVREIRPGYSWDVSCQKSVPESIICFLDSNGYEDTIRNVVSLGGDADTMSCIAGGIAQAYWKTVPVEIVAEVRQRLPGEFLDIVDRFAERFIDG
jgi:ADP-ribosylglycohydrolase